MNDTPSNRIVISAGHGKYVRGASGYLDEVDEARHVMHAVAHYLEELGIGVETYADDVSKTQSENLERIVDFHNSKTRDLDVSIHFNAYVETENPMGCEVLYLTQAEIASKVSNVMAKAAQFINRGAKKRTDLYFLNNTAMPAILLEVCFVDSAADAELYGASFDRLCRGIAAVLSGLHFTPRGVPDYQTDIVASVFGGEGDYNVSAYDEDKVLNDTDFYVALPDRFEGERPLVQVYNRKTGKVEIAQIEDIGPWNIDDPYWDLGSRPQAESGTDMSGRATNGAGIDLSPALAEALGVDGMGKVDWKFVEDGQEITSA
jgi:N-acetylmuramoyl-L-alanine amidase